MSQFIFKNFGDYYHFFQYLSHLQREVIFSSLSTEEQSFLEKSCAEGGWEDLIVRNELNRRVNEIKEKYGFDLIASRIKVLRNKTVYIDTKIWKHIVRIFSDYSEKHIVYILGGIEEKIVNRDTSLLIPKKPSRTEGV